MTSTPDIDATSSDEVAEEGAGRWKLLFVLLLGQFMALLDVTIVNVAMPTIRSDLHTSGAELQLVVSGYTVSYAMLLITSARLGGLHGRRRLFMAGLLGFTTSSLLCGLAPTVTVLIVARFVQGIGAALMMPQIMSVIQLRFTGSARAKALSAYSVVISVGALAGMILGGLLVSADILGTGWRPIFLVNVPIGLIVAALVPRLIPADDVGTRRGLDLVGLAVVVPAVFLIVLPLVLGHEENWPAWTFICITVGGVLAAVFVWLEWRMAERRGDPLLNLDVLRAPGVGAGIAALSFGIVAYGGFLFTLALHLQSFLGDSALRAGLTVAPAGVTFGLFGFYWRRLPTRVHHVLTPVGFSCGAAAVLAIALALGGGTHGGPLLLAGLLMFGAALGVALSPLLTQALVHVPPSKASDASGLLTTTMQLGQVVGVATLGSLFLSLAAQPAADAAVHALTTTLGWLALLFGLAAVAGLVLARTALQAERAAAVARTNTSSTKLLTGRPRASG